MTSRVFTSGSMTAGGESLPGDQDRVAQESQGPIYDRTKEHLGASDEGVIMLRAMIRESIDATREGKDPVWTLRDPAQNQNIAFDASMQEIGALT